MDLISSEYGWDDDKILTLSLRRLKQITTTIIQRQYLERRKERSLLSWQTRTLATYISASAGAGADKLLESSMQIGLDTDEIEELERLNKEAKSRPVEPQEGSYEKLMMLSQRLERPTP